MCAVWSHLRWCVPLSCQAVRSGWQACSSRDNPSSLLWVGVTLATFQLSLHIYIYGMPVYCPTPVNVYLIKDCMQRWLHVCEGNTMVPLALLCVIHAVNTSKEVNRAPCKGGNPSPAHDPSLLQPAWLRKICAGQQVFSLDIPLEVFQHKNPPWNMWFECPDKQQ